jgi:hypothetical protein
MHKIFFLMLLYFLSACNNDLVTNKNDLLESGYEKFGCNELGYEDIKSDGSNPYYKVYSHVEVIDNSLEMLIARCYDNNTCHHEYVHNDEVICQKFFIHGEKEALTKRWVDHTILAFNIKRVL